MDPDLRLIRDILVTLSEEEEAQQRQLAELKKLEILKGTESESEYSQKIRFMKLVADVDRADESLLVGDLIDKLDKLKACNDDGYKEIIEMIDDEIDELKVVNSCMQSELDKFQEKEEGN